MQDFVGKTKAVLFTPTDMELITGSPGSRRRYLDFVISQFDHEYSRCLTSYEKGLRQRNRLLELIRENLAQRHQLFFWDRLIINNGDYITQARAKYLTGLNSKKYEIIYDKSIVSETRLKQYELEEVAAGTTLVGPHRDDFVLLNETRDISKFGSRGEQRMAMLWLKQGEIVALSENGLPILLLDDIFSELDHKHREEVLQMIMTHQLAGGQTIMTSAEENPETTGDIIRL
jgi:DNA replication and repair protein RecF